MFRLYMSEKLSLMGLYLGAASILHTATRVGMLESYKHLAFCGHCLFTPMIQVHLVNVEVIESTSDVPCATASRD